MSSRLVLIGLIAVGLAGPAQAAAPQQTAVLGAWRTNTDAGVVQISACAEGVCGALVTSDKLKADPRLPDRKNKDPGQRARPLSGVSILRGFDWSGQAWTGGRIYDPSTGETYNATLKVVDGALVVKGCIAPLLCRSERWKRVG